MTRKNRARLFLALNNAAEMIRGHLETGLEPEDVREKDEAGLGEYDKAAQRAFKMISTLANKYRKK